MSLSPASTQLTAAFGKVVDQVGRTAAGFGTILGQTQASPGECGRDAKLATGKLINIGGKPDRAAVELPVFPGHFPMVMGQGAYLNIYA